jgi:hypothetical protein
MLSTGHLKSIALAVKPVALTAVAKPVAVAVGVALRALPATHPGITPNGTGIPGLSTLQVIVGGLLTAGLIACVAGIGQAPESRHSPDVPSAMTSTKSARVIRAADAEQAIAALRTQRNQQETLITAYFEAVSAADTAQAKIDKVRAAGVEAIAKGQGGSRRQSAPGPTGRRPHGRRGP